MPQQFVVCFGWNYIHLGCFEHAVFIKDRVFIFFDLDCVPGNLQHTQRISRLYIAAQVINGIANFCRVLKYVPVSVDQDGIPIRIFLPRLIQGVQVFKLAGTFHQLFGIHKNCRNHRNASVADKIILPTEGYIRHLAKLTAQLPQVFLFEPGQLRHGLFYKTIVPNLFLVELNEKVFVHKFAQHFLISLVHQYFSAVIFRVHAQPFFMIAFQQQHVFIFVQA